VLVVLTRELGLNDELRRWVGARADAVEIPLTTTLYRSMDIVREEVRAGSHFGDFRSLVVTSARTARYAAVCRDALGEAAKVFSVGAATTRALEREGLTVSATSTGTALELAPLITEGPVLVLGAQGGRDDLASALERDRYSPVSVECYRTRGVELDAAATATLSRADVVFIGAPSAWRVARAVVSKEAWILVPGETTRDAVASDHQRVLVGWGEEFERAWGVLTSTSRDVPGSDDS